MGYQLSTLTFFSPNWNLLIGCTQLLSSWCQTNFKKNLNEKEKQNLQWPCWCVFKYCFLFRCSTWNVSLDSDLSLRKGAISLYTGYMAIVSQLFLFSEKYCSSGYWHYSYPIVCNVISSWTCFDKQTGPIWFSLDLVVHCILFFKSILNEFRNLA